MNRIKKWALFFLVIFYCMTYTAFSGAENRAISLDHFKRIIILENGRKKPLDTYARNMLKQFSGKSQLNGEPAIVWLSRVLFTPKRAYDDRIFLINHPEVLNSLGIEVTAERDRYSFSQLSAIFPRLNQLAHSASRLKNDEKTVVENEIIFLFNKVYLYQQLSESLGFAVPQGDLLVTDKEIKKAFNLPVSKNVFSLLDLMKNITLIEQVENDILSNKPEHRSRFENGMAQLVGKILKNVNSLQSHPLTIIYDPEDHIENWISPSESLKKSLQLHKPIRKEIKLLGELAGAYIGHDQGRFDRSLKTFNELMLEKMDGNVTAKKVSAEILYNRIDPFYKSQLFYGFSLFLSMLSFLIFKRWFYRISFIFICGGVLFHSYGIISRMIIMSRPPVTNLYETFIFTGWMTVILGIILEVFKKRNIGLLTGSISGIIMLLIAGKYALEGDTMGMLVAVLDSNFWLSTHVITITIGFAGIVISGIIGHVYVFQVFFNADRRDVLKNTYQSIYATQAFGLIFTFLGTVMGGMWADQSWGRFWGWDPKENGALVVVLWSVILFHARLSKWIGHLGFALGSIVGIITIALAWFGINLLGVGLHSYGFTSGIALVLMIFIILEFIFILTSGIYLKKSIRS